MKKRKIILGILVLLICNLFVLKVDAISVSYTGSKAQLPKAGGGTYGMKLYRANINGKSLMTYCLDAGRTYRGDGQYDVEHVIDPYKSQNTSWYKFDVAATYAYQYMYHNGYATTTEDNNIIGELVFRWITEAYASAGCGPTCGPTLSPAYRLFRKLTVGFNPSDSRVAAAINIYNLATSLAERNLPYDQLIANGYDNNGQGLWGVKWEVTTFTNSPLNSEQNQLYIEMKPSNGVKLDRIDFNQFSVYFTNESVKNNIISQSAAKVSDDTVSITVTFNKGAWDGQDVGAVVRAYFCDSMDASTQLYLLKRANGYQRMLTVLPGAGSCKDRDDNPHGGPRDYPVHESNCTCDTNTGEYVYRRYKDGNLVEEVKWYETDANSEANKTKYSCPATCSKRENICKKPSESNDGKYHCPDSPNSDGSCTEEEYKKQCTHTCQNPDESGDGKYYCKESSPGAGDGKECSKNEYEIQCLGKVNCTPTINMPSDCNDFDIEGTEKGSIGDINKTASSCNPNVNEIKQCVLDGTDLTGETFEATNEIQDNPYCKVWCEETFNFTLPTARLSDSGGYFTIDTTISGERNCYISGAADPKQPIDSTKFNNDLAAKQKEVVEAWNEYSKWKTAVNIFDTFPQEKSSGPCSCCGSKSCGENGDSCCGETGGPYLHTLYYYNWNYEGFDPTTKSSKTYREDLGVSGSVGCNECGDGGEDGVNRKDDFIRYRDSAKQTLISKINELNAIIIKYNDCTGSINSGIISDLISTAANSSGWDNDFDFDPIVTYNYNQDYINQMNGTMQQAGSDNPGSNYSYCSGDTDDQYNCQSGNSSTIQTNKLRFFRCDESRCFWDESTVNLSTAKWIKKTKTNKATFKPDNNFSTYTQYGTIRFDVGNNYLYTKLPEDALPVSLITETGVFPFVITYNNIGQSNSSGEANGRLIGKSTSVLTEYNKLDEGLKCSDKKGTETMEQSIGYVCHYLNNCKDDCDFSCDDDNNCEFDGGNCKDGVCTFICENCIYDGDKSTYSYRTVSLNKLFPNERTGSAGYNWNGTIKGQITQQEIESNSDKIYETPEYSYTLTPNNLKNIRDYNDKVGSYTNTKTSDNEDAMRCTNQEIDGVYYTVKCTSTFLDMLEGLENENYNFARYKNKYAQQESLIRPAYDDRFTLADEMTDSNGNQVCANFRCVSKESYIGPAWK